MASHAALLIAHASPHQAERHHPTVVLNSPIKFSDDPAGVDRGVPSLNQHSDEIRSELEAD